MSDSSTGAVGTPPIDALGNPPSDAAGPPATDTRHHGVGATPERPTARWDEPDPPFPGWVLLVALIALAGVVAALRAPAVVSSTPQPVAAAPDVGNPLTAYHCLTCHSLAPGPPGVPASAPPLDGVLATAAARIADPSYDGTATTPLEYLRESVVNHCTYVVPGYDCTGIEVHGNWMTPAQVDEVVDFLARLPGGGS